MIGNGEEVLDFVAVILVFGEQTGKSDDEMLRQFVSVVVHRLLFFCREDLASGTAAHGSLARRRLLYRATPWERGEGSRPLRHA